MSTTKSYVFSWEKQLTAVVVGNLVRFYTEATGKVVANWIGRFLWFAYWDNACPHTIKRGPTYM